jgi:hypothetical protein
MKLDEAVGFCGELRVLQSKSIREIQAPDLRNATITTTLQQVHYLTAEGVIIK